MTDRHRTVSRVVAILEHVARDEAGSALGTLVRDVGAPRSTIHGFVRGLVAEGYLAQGDGGRYVLGPGAHTLLASRSTSTIELLDPVMRELAHALGETVTLAVPVGAELAYVHTIPAAHPIAYVPVLRTRRPVWPTSAGKVFLACGARGLDADGAVRGLDEDVLSAELAAVRASGYATNVGETVTDVAAVATGVDIGGGGVCAIVVGGPRARIEHHLEDAAARTTDLLRRHGLERT